jgi:hypothetical protein
MVAPRVLFLDLHPLVKNSIKLQPRRFPSLSNFNMPGLLTHLSLKWWEKTIIIAPAS